MADVVDPCCVAEQVTKFDKNNNTPPNLDDGSKTKQRIDNQILFSFSFS
jgi:hypothetical protein